MFKLDMVHIIRIALRRSGLGLAFGIWQNRMAHPILASLDSTPTSKTQTKGLGRVPRRNRCSVFGCPWELPHSRVAGLQMVGGPIRVELRDSSRGIETSFRPRCHVMCRFWNAARARVSAPFQVSSFCGFLLLQSQRHTFVLLRATSIVFAILCSGWRAQAEHDYGFRVGIECLPLLPLLKPLQRPNHDHECSLCIHKNNETTERVAFSSWLINLRWMTSNESLHQTL